MTVRENVLVLSGGDCLVFVKCLCDALVNDSTQLIESIWKRPVQELCVHWSFLLNVIFTTVLRMLVPHEALSKRLLRVLGHLSRCIRPTAL